MRNLFIILTVLLIPVIISCEKLFIEKDAENTNMNNFDLLWTTIDRKYSFFEYKNINWDSIKHVYRPKANNHISNEQLFDIMSDMLLELRDGHVNLYSDFKRSTSWEWQSKYPANFNYSLLQRFLLRGDYLKIGPFETTNIGYIGYIYIESFADIISKQDIDTVINHFKGMKGIIIDVRNNSGGLSKNVKLVASRFADRKWLASYSLYKTGPGHGDFSSPQPNYIYPEGEKQYIKPVVLLTNRRTYSATNDFVLNMSVFPHVTIMGDITGGGGGTPYDYELLNGWRYRFPRTMTLRPNGFNVEHGIPPDIRVNLLSRDALRGLDTIIEAAIEYLNN